MYQGVFTDFAWQIDQKCFCKTSHMTLIIHDNIKYERYNW